MAKEENIILPVVAGLGILLLFSGGDNQSPVIVPVPGTTPTNFIKKYWGQALDSQRSTTIPALATITQAGLESGWGKFAPKHNYFGIKASQGWTGPTQLLDTTEYYNGQPVKIKALFRAYPSAAAGFADHGRFFLVNPRYKTALQYRDNNIQFVKEIAKAGYATDPKYADKMIQAMKLVVIILQNEGLI